jgi:septal ring factor EnvC (AmiA/AmiB activator)
MAVWFAFLAATLASLPTASHAAAADDRQRGLSAASTGAVAGVGANPIRKVVTMLQSMEKKVQEEAAKEKEAFDKFMCYCKTSGSDLKSSIAAAGTKVPQLGSDIKEAQESLVQLKSDVKQAQGERAEAKSAIAEATSAREKDAAAYAAEKSVYDANIGAIKGAVKALIRGMAGAFLQTTGAAALKKLVNDKKDMLEEDRQTILAFLSGSQGSSYTPSGGDVTGILKSMGDDMEASLKDATATETAAIKGFQELIGAKTKEVQALTAAIESKTVRIGELSVEIVQMQNDLTDTEEGLVADKEFLAGLDTSCKTKMADWEERVKTRGEELTALAETIKVLNDDDALELFKKTLPTTSASLVQVEKKISAAALRARALAVLSTLHPRQRSQVDLIALALHGRGVDFSKVIAMVDEMIGTLKKEQIDDENKKEYCAVQLDSTEDSKKALERSISTDEDAIDTATEGIAKLKDEIKALEDGIKALDKAMAEASDLRKQQHEEFTELLASDSAAKELIEFAKNRLNKFYNPKLYKPPAKVELSSEGRIEASLSGTEPPTEAPGGIAGTGVTVLVQVSSHKHLRRAAPAPPPETFGAYTKKTEENTGVIALMDLLIKELEKEITEATQEEKDSQKDYEAMMKESATKHVMDTKLITEKSATKAEMEEDLEMHTESKASASKKLAATLQYIQSLHTECDWLLKYFFVRKDARDEEIDALSKTKAVLSGADYSLLQTTGRGFLGRARTQ